MTQDERWQSLVGFTNLWNKGYSSMDQETRWMKKYNEVVEFINTNHRNPSRHRIEEHDMLNWCKANRKRMNAGDKQPTDLQKKRAIHWWPPKKDSPF